jgi:hypothetical protein
MEYHQISTIPQFIVDLKVRKKWRIKLVYSSLPPQWQRPWNSPEV